jgi:hypothetical protein
MGKENLIIYIPLYPIPLYLYTSIPLYPFPPPPTHVKQMLETCEFHVNNNIYICKLFNSTGI